MEMPDDRARQCASVHCEVGVESQPPLVPLFAEFLAVRFGLPDALSRLITLGAAAAAVGRTRSVKSPVDERTLPAAFNCILVADTPGIIVRQAATFAFGPLQNLAGERMHSAHERGRKELWAEKIRLEQRGDVLREHLCSGPPLPPQPPLTIPVPHEERIREAMPAVIKEAEQVAERLHEIGVELAPWTFTDGLSRKEIPLIQRHSFDATLASIALDGHALRQLQGFSAGERRDVARFLLAAWRGELFSSGPVTSVEAQVSNFWIVSPKEFAVAGGDSVLQTEGLFRHFLMARSTDAPAQSVEDRKCSGVAQEAWAALTKRLWGERIRNQPQTHGLETEAERIFHDFREETRRICSTVSPSEALLASFWPEQALKMALLLHACSEESDEELICADTIELAIRWMREFGKEQFLACKGSMSTEPDDPVEKELRHMISKVRIHGPLRVRDLFRRYDRGCYARLEPILALGIERGLLKNVTGLVRLADGNLPQG